MTSKAIGMMIINRFDAGLLLVVTGEAETP